MTGGREHRGGRSVPEARGPAAEPSTAGAVLAAALIVAATAWVYAPALRGSWLWDDGLEVVHAPLLRDPGLWWKAWVRPAGLDYYPLKTLAQGVLWRLFGAVPFGWHAVNAALHALSSLLLWRLLARIGVRQAWLGGLLFAVHPVAVESVAWIAEFKNVLALPPLLLALTAWQDHLRTGARRSWALAFALFVVSLLCKTSAVAIPVFLLVQAWWVRDRLLWSDAGKVAPFAAAALALGSATLWAQGHLAMGTGELERLPGLGARLSEAGWALVQAFGTSFLPTGLRSIYPAAPGLWAGLAGWAAVLGTGAVLALASEGRRVRGALLGWAWMVLSLAPVLGLIPMAYLRVAPRADHLNYLALAGAAGLVAAGLGELWAAGGGSGTVEQPGFGTAGPGTRAGAGERSSAVPRAVGRGGIGRAWPALAAVAAAALVCTGAERARALASNYRDEGSFWAEAVRLNPASWLARANLGRVLLDGGRPEAAVAELERAVADRPDSAEACVDLGTALEACGRRQEARDRYEQALRTQPAFAGAHYNLGRLLLRSGQAGSAAAEFRAAIAADATHAGAHNNLGLALVRLGEPGAARREYRAALALEPGMAEVHVNLGNLDFRAGDLEGAVAEYREALKLAPGYAAARANLSQALARLGTGEGP